MKWIWNTKSFTLICWKGEFIPHLCLRSRCGSSLAYLMISTSISSILVASAPKSLSWMALLISPQPSSSLSWICSLPLMKSHPCFSSLSSLSRANSDTCSKLKNQQFFIPIALIQNGKISATIEESYFCSHECFLSLSKLKSHSI